MINCDKCENIANYKLTVNGISSNLCAKCTGDAFKVGLYSVDYLVENIKQPELFNTLKNL